MQIKFFRIKNKTLESNYINDVKIDNGKILLYNELYGVIINVNTKQIESILKELICFFGKINFYYLVGHNNGMISQINVVNKNIYTSFKFEKKEKVIFINDIGIISLLLLLIIILIYSITNNTNNRGIKICHFFNLNFQN